MSDSIERPVSRSALRLRLGRIYYTFQRHLVWLFGGIKFARRREKELRYAYFSHQTPLLRRLKNVDMWMQQNKIINLRLAVPKVNKITLYPGETFSYWKTIGRPSRRKGYAKGMVLQNGRVTAGTGGGLCQLSNLIYWMAIHTPLTVVERHRHDYDVFPDSGRTQPFGSGATCFYNYGDLMIKNDTDQVFQLVIEITQTDLSGTWKTDKASEYTYEVYEKEHKIQHAFWGGYTRHNLLYRKKHGINGVVKDDEFVVENHAIMMYQPFLADTHQ